MLPQISCHLLEGPRGHKAKLTACCCRESPKLHSGKPHCQVNFIYKHTSSWMTVLKAPGPQAPKTDQHVFNQYYNDNCCKHHQRFSPSPSKWKHSWVWIPHAKSCMMWYPPTGNKLLAALKFACAVFRAPGPAQFYCHSAQLMWFNEDHDLIPARVADYLLQMGGGILYKGHIKTGKNQNPSSLRYDTLKESLNILC